MKTDTAPAPETPHLLDFLNLERCEAIAGKPEYGYFKQQIRYSQPTRRKDSGYHIAGSSWIPVSEEEFLRERPESDRIHMETFMGKRRGVYTHYERRLIPSKEGWVKALEEALLQYKIESGTRASTPAPALAEANEKEGM